MIDKEKRELKDGVISIFKNFNILDHTATIGGLRNDILGYIDSMQEGPVSENLEIAAKKEAEIVNALGGEFPPNPLDMELIKTIFIHGAQWQKEKEYTCYEEAFEDGAKWKKEKTIDKACKWIDENAAKYLVDRFVGSTRVVGIDTSITEDFRKDMEDEIQSKV